MYVPACEHMNVSLCVYIHICIFISCKRKNCVRVCVFKKSNHLLPQLLMLPLQLRSSKCQSSSDRVGGLSVTLGAVVVVVAAAAGAALVVASSFALVAAFVYLKYRFSITLDVFALASSYCCACNLHLALTFCLPANVWLCLCVCLPVYLQLNNNLHIWLDATKWLA